MKSLQYIGIAITALIFASCTEKKNENSAVETMQVQERIYPVRINKIEKQSVERTLDYTATLAAFKEIHYAPASPGRIDKINVEVGTRVKKGQILVETDRTQLKQAQTQFNNAKTTFERIDTLYKLGSTSEQQYDQAKTGYEVAKSSLDFLIENTVLKSPIDGIVTGKYFENGELYSGVPNTTAGKAAVISLMQINPLKALVDISQNYYPLLKEGMKARVSIDIYPDTVFVGTISKIYPVIDQITRTFKVEVLVRNNSEILRPGMFARFNINLEVADALIVPAIAVLKEEGTNNRYVFTENNGIARYIKVETGKRFNDRVEIISPEIEENMNLVVEGQGNLLEGSKVKVVSIN